MQDVFAYCAELVRAADRDRFIASLFAPAERRGALHALYAFNAEVARVRDLAHTALPGEIRLQWWSDVINGERAEEAHANPVAAALLVAVERHRLSSAKLIDLIEAHRFDLYDEPMARVADLEAYARNTSSGLLALAAQILSGVEVETVTQPAGIAYAIAGLLRAFPLHAARGQLYVPMELLDRHQAPPHEVFAGRSSAGLEAALADLRNLTRRHLAVAREGMSALPPQAVPALIQVTLVRPLLDRLEHGEPFTPAEIPAWRRQWLIWRAARNPARIAN
jgi:15-cis-phytoene synthase